MAFASFVKTSEGLFILRPPNGTELGVWIFFIETIYTCVLVLVVIHVKYANVAPTNDSVLSCLAVILTIYCLIGLAGDVSKACFNPAVGIATNVYHLLADTEGYAHHVDYLFAYTFGPLTGAVIAVYIMDNIGFKYPNEPNQKYTNITS